MTLTSPTQRSTGTGDNSTTDFPYSFLVYTDAEVNVYIDNVLQTLTTHYTVSGVGSSGGNIEFVTAPATDEALVFVRATAQTQTTNFTPSGSFPAEANEDALDKLTQLAQKAQLGVDEGFGFDESVTDAGTVRVSSNAATRASKVLAFDSSGDLTDTQELGTNQGDWTTATAYVLRDIVNDSSNDNVYICNTAHTSTGTTPVSSNADVAKWDLIIDAAAVATSATNAATSASNASTSETNASTSASNAATSETNAAASAVTAAAAAATDVYVVSTGSANAYVLAPTNAITSYTAGNVYFMKANFANTGACTVNVSAVGAKNIKKFVGSGITDPVADDIESGGIYHLVYDGTQFLIVGLDNQDAVVTLAGDNTWTGLNTFTELKTVNSPDIWRNAPEAITRASDATFTVTDNAENQGIYIAGRPIRYADVAGTWSYGMVTGYSTGTVTLRGAPMTTSFDLLLEFGEMSRVASFPVYITSTFADAADADLIVTDMAINLHWPMGRAYCVGFDVICETADSGANDPRVNVDIAGANAVSSSNSSEGPEVTETIARTTTDITVANYDIDLYDVIEITTDANGSNNDAADLTLTLYFVVE